MTAPVKKYLHYNPETGVFIRRIKTANCISVGDIAGGLEHGYIVIQLCGIKYKAHRLAWFYVHGVWPKDQIDHINHIRDDNRLSNLREATNKSNGKNQSMYPNNTSGITGVARFRKNRWQAYITNNGKLFPLGKYKDKFDAVCARKSAENKYGFHENHGK